jgi:hypothetical protein
MTEWQVDYVLIPALACASALAIGLTTFLVVVGNGWLRSREEAAEARE